MLPFYKTTHLGAQVGGNMGNNYVHQHRLIDLLTGQWGIGYFTNTTAGSFFSNAFTYRHS